MSQTAKLTGINLKAAPLGESDRLLTILSPEVGLLRAVAPGSRKHQSRLAGRSDLFVINQWLVIKGKRLDKVVQAETLRSFPGLSHHLGRLTASQYLAEVVLFMALSDCSQVDLFDLLVTHLAHLETSPSQDLLAALCHGLYQLLRLGGVAPEMQRCCLSQRQIVPNFLDPGWRVQFSFEAGGLVQGDDTPPGLGVGGRSRTAEPTQIYSSGPTRHPRPIPLTALEVMLLQHLSQAEGLGPAPRSIWPAQGQPDPQVWARLERLLRQWAQDYLERPIRSAALIDVCLASV
jgi:DNA repair protein RecO (recombination protein O)